jgi:A/G-specific adenine glycosylase
MLSDHAIHEFRETVWDFYHDKGRHDLPWRQTDDPYHILVSEVMLQQTQVGRVRAKYEEFLLAFPTIESLAKAPLGKVLRTWSGLGYNRRAQYLQQAAQYVREFYAGSFPDGQKELEALPGVGRNTAGAILAYAYNRPVVFIETNIRTVYIHHFFNDKEAISDAELLPLVEATLDAGSPREWYWALMDYGAWLKQAVGNVNVQSKHYAKQSKFAGSKRQIRGQVLKTLSDAALTKSQLRKRIPDERLSAVLSDLLGEGLIRRQGNRLSL